MKLQKVLSAVLGATMICAAFSGCSSTVAVNDKDDQGRTVLSVGNWPSEDTTDKNYLETITRQRAEFEEENPTMAITPDTWGFDLQTFYSKAAANQLPGLYYANFTEIEKIAAGEYYTDLTEGLKRAGYEGAFNEAILNLITRDGKICTFPTNAYSLGLAYNVDLFEKAGLMQADGTPMQPKTWDEVVEFGKKITEATGKPGFAIPTMGNCGGWLFTPIAWSYGVDFMEADENNNYTATFATDKIVDALTYIRDLKWKHNIFLPNSLVDLTEYYKQFAIGNLGMIVTAGNFTSQLYQYEMPIEHMGIMAIPAGPEKHITLTGGYTATVANGATEDQVDVAIKWMEKIGNGNKLDDKLKETIEKNYQDTVEDGKVVGIDGLSVWGEETEITKFSDEMRNKYANINLNHVRLYNESLSNPEIELRPEEPVCAQELYAVLDGIIQEILTNENADITALVEKAQSDFQANYLNNLD